MKPIDFSPIKLLDQLSCLLLVIDKQSNFIYSNPHTTKLFGYTSFDQLFGKNAYDIPCRAAESAEAFIEQDRRVCQNQEQLMILDFHTYADEQSRILLTKKYPFYQDGEQVGLICQATEIQSETLQTICRQLVNSDQYYLDKKRHGGSYAFEMENDSQVSKRERDCLFYLLRGKTMKEIGAKLTLSARTVESYLESAKDKLGCSKRSQLIEYCISAGYLKYIPSDLALNELSIII